MIEDDSDKTEIRSMGVIAGVFAACIFFGGLIGSLVGMQQLPASQHEFGVIVSLIVNAKRRCSGVLPCR